MNHNSKSIDDCNFSIKPITRENRGELNSLEYKMSRVQSLLLKEEVDNDEIKKELGFLCIDIKAQLRGKFQQWVKKELKVTIRSVERYMAYAKRCKEATPVSLLGYIKSDVLSSSGLSGTDLDDFIKKKHLVKNEEKTVQDMSRRELEAVLKSMKTTDNLETEEFITQKRSAISTKKEFHMRYTEFQTYLEELKFFITELRDDEETQNDCSKAIINLCRQVQDWIQKVCPHLNEFP